MTSSFAALHTNQLVCRQACRVSSRRKRLSAELEKDRQVASIEASIKQKTTLVAGYTTDRAKLVTPGSEARVARLTALTTAAEKVRSYLRFYANQEQALLALRDEVADLRRPGGIQAA